MLEELQKIDVTAIEELMEIKREREVISTRLARMQQEQANVSEVVVRRVRRDYESRLSGLDRKAAPLKERARQEYAKLKALLDRLEAQHQSARLDREEVEFRNRLGEFEGEEYTRRCRELDDRLSAQEADLDEAREVKARFLEAFESEADLALPAAPPTAPPPPPSAPPPPPPSISLGPLAAMSASVLPPPPGGVSGEDPGITAPQPLGVGPATLGVTSPPPPPPPPPPVPLPPPVPAGAEPDGTIVLPPEPAPLAPPSAPVGASAGADPMGATALLSVPEAPPAAAVGKTLVMTRGKLIAIDTDLGASEFVLEPLTFLGRTPENTIRLNKPAVSRRHAQISQSDTGYILRDLNSENGTYVNGERVKERQLQDGDRVQIGTVRFVFRTS